jgi:hypothetical protein
VGYAKLFSQIIHSTIWREDKATKVLWVTMLAMADKDGVVEASLPGLADAARIELEECLTGLQVLMNPDPYSRTKDFDGRRIMEVDGGWALLNYPKYRAIKSEEEVREKNRQKVADWRASKRAKVTEPVTNVTNCNPMLPPMQSTEAASEAVLIKESCGEPSASPPPSPGKPEKKSKIEDDSPVVMLVPCKGVGSSTWPLTQAKMDEWKAAFPGVNLTSEIRIAVQWLRDNPARGKTYSGMASFFCRWLSKEQNRSHPSQGALNATPSYRSSDSQRSVDLAREHQERVAATPLPGIDPLSGFMGAESPAGNRAR